MAQRFSRSITYSCRRLHSFQVWAQRHIITSSRQQKTSGSARVASELKHPEQGSDLHLKQVAIPDVYAEFKGLETEFPCLTKHGQTGPEPIYDRVVTGYKTYHHQHPFHLAHGVLPELNVAYETWGELNEKKDNAVLVCTGLSGSSHMKSHKDNVRSGWWERFVGPGCALDTDKFFLICTNNLGGCYGTTGPSSVNPITGKPYATTFPIITVPDMARIHVPLLDHLGIDKLYACVGSSLGGMLSLTFTALHPERVGRVVSISSCLASSPSSIAMRYLQRKAIMMDHNWQHGYYYGTNKYPKNGMKLAREVATLTYRSGPEWQQRFGREVIDDKEEPSLCPYYMIENYLDYQGESQSVTLDPNSMIYISKTRVSTILERFTGMKGGAAYEAKLWMNISQGSKRMSSSSQYLLLQPRRLPARLKPRHPIWNKNGSCTMIEPVTTTHTKPSDDNIGIIVTIHAGLEHRFQKIRHCAPLPVTNRRHWIYALANV